MEEEGRCFFCGESIETLPFVCKFCGRSFCVEHQLPENHSCEGLEKWKRGELEEFKKPIGPPEQKPFDLDKMTGIVLEKRRKVGLILTVIMIILFIVLWLVKSSA